MEEDENNAFALRSEKMYNSFGSPSPPLPLISKMLRRSSSLGRSGSSSSDGLPPELWSQIFSYFFLKDLPTLALVLLPSLSFLLLWSNLTINQQKVCRDWHDIVSHPANVRELAYNQYGGYKYLKYPPFNTSRPNLNVGTLRRMGRGQDLQDHVRNLHRLKLRRDFTQEFKEQSAGAKGSCLAAIIWLLGNSYLVDLLILCLLACFYFGLGLKVDNTLSLSWWLILFPLVWAYLAFAFSSFYDYMTISLQEKMYLVEEGRATKNPDRGFDIFADAEDDFFSNESHDERTRLFKRIRGSDFGPSKSKRRDKEEQEEEGDIELIKAGYDHSSPFFEVPEGRPERPRWYHYLFQDRRSDGAMLAQGNSITRVIWTSGLFKRKQAMPIVAGMSLVWVVFPFLLTLRLVEGEMWWASMYVVMLPLFLASIGGCFIRMRGMPRLRLVCVHICLMVFYLLVALQIEGVLNFYWSIILICIHLALIGLGKEILPLLAIIGPMVVVLLVGLRLDEVGSTADLAWVYWFLIFLGILGPWALVISCALCCVVLLRR